MEHQPADKKSNNTGRPGKSQQDGDIGGRYNVGGDDAGIGFAKQAEFNGRSPGRHRSADDNEQPHIGKIQEYPVGRGLLESTNIPDLDLLLEQYHGKKLSNSDILKVVSTAT